MVAQTNIGALIIGIGCWSIPKGPGTQLSYTLKNSNLRNYCPKPEYLIVGSFGPLGYIISLQLELGRVGSVQGVWMQTQPSVVLVSLAKHLAFKDLTLSRSKVGNAGMRTQNEELRGPHVN